MTPVRAIQEKNIKDAMVGSILSAVLLILAFPNYNLWLLAWFGFVPLFLAIRNKSKGRAFLLSYLTGVIFWLGTIYWLVHVTFIGMVILVLYLALYFGIFGLLVSLVTGYWLLVTGPAIWVLLEYLRSHLFTGFPWALLGYSQYLNLPVIQIADITAVWGVSFLVMMANVAIYGVVSRRSPVFTGFKKYLIPVLCIIITLSYGYYRLYQRPTTNDQRLIKISVIQGNIPQELKWEINSREFILARYFNLSKEAVGDNPDLIIWPEAALPVVLEEEPVFFEEVKKFARETNTPLLLGAVTLRDKSYYNSAILLSAQGKLLNRYDKLHLVPFGEYIPLRAIFTFLETVVPIGDFIPGKEYTIFKIPNPKISNNFAALICFEDLFPELSREFVKRGADFLINITNDAWFGRTSSPYQHLQASVFRAVENRVSVVRSANTGISGFIAPSGKIMALVRDETGKNIFIDGYKTKELLIPARRLTFYSHYGEIFIMGCFLWVLYAIISPLRKRR